MQALFGARGAADINLVLQILLLAGLLVGFYLARQKRFKQHGNVQTAMVLLNLVLIVAMMAPSLYGYVIAGQSTTGRVARLMIGHGVLGLIVQLVALYLVVRMRTNLIPERWRVSNIKRAMRLTLAVWTVLVLLGVGIYGERYLNQRTIASAPLLEFRQLGADLYVHAVELQDASARGSLPAVKRHAEHPINLIEGKSGLHYGDNDIDGYMEDPGDGVGLLARLDTVTTVTDEAEVTARAGEVRAQLEQVIDLSVDLAGAQAVTDTTAPVAAVFNLARQANGLGVFGIDFAARTAGVIEAPALAVASPSATGPGGVAIVEDEFLFLPEVLTIPAGTTVTWVNDEQPKHTATSDDRLFDTGDQLLGDSYSHTFDAPGIYPYYCRYHGDIDGVGMAGTIVVE